MMEKLINKIIMLLSLFIVSCGGIRSLDYEIFVFKRESFPMRSNCYLFLKPSGNYEVYTYFSHWYSIFGKWELVNDTLFLIPRYEYNYLKDSIHETN